MKNITAKRLINAMMKAAMRVTKGDKMEKCRLSEGKRRDNIWVNEMRNKRKSLPESDKKREKSRLQNDKMKLSPKNGKKAKSRLLKSAKKNQEYAWATCARNSEKDTLCA